MSAAPLQGLLVWVTRPFPENARSAEFWASQGATVVGAPLLEIRRERVADDELSRVASSPPDHVVFTSARAVESLVELASHRPELLAALYGLPCWTVGAKTQRAAGEAGFSDLRSNPRSSARDLAEHMVQLLEPLESVLFPAARQRRPELPAVFARAGITLTEWAVYDTVAVSPEERGFRNALDSKSAPLLLLYSPTAAIAAADLLGQFERMELNVATLGATTQTAALDGGLCVVAHASLPTEEALLEALSAWWSQQPRAAE